MSKYSALPDLESICLLKLALGSKLEPIIVGSSFPECVLDATDYSVISFAWGDSRVIPSVHCQTEFFSITVNVRSALTQVRRTAKAPSSCYVMSGLILHITCS